MECVIYSNTGIYFWRATPNDDLPTVAPPTILSSAHDLLFDGHPEHDPLTLPQYLDGSYASCPKTRRSYSGMTLRVAGGPVAYKSRLQPTVALSSTESEYYKACDGGKSSLFVRSVMWDLGVPQHAATIAYDDNDAAIAMANTRKPTSRTRHINSRHHALMEWVEGDLIKLERIDTSQNLANHFTKQLTQILFKRHVDYIMGHVPPKYSSCYQKTYGMLRRQLKDKVTSTPATPISIDPAFTPPAAAAAKLAVQKWSHILGYSISIN